MSPTHGLYYPKARGIIYHEQNLCKAPGEKSVVYLEGTLHPSISLPENGRILYILCQFKNLESGL
jgi:hypothetical protein